MNREIDEEIKNTLVISRDRAVQSKEFSDLFQNKDGSDFYEFSKKSHQLWIHLCFLVSIIRIKPGATMCELEAKMHLSRSEIRHCLRLILSLGGEIEVKCEEWQDPAEGRFFLHN